MLLQARSKFVGETSCRRNVCAPYNLSHACYSHGTDNNR